MPFWPLSRRARYDKRFFDGFAEASQASATIVLRHLFEAYRPTSILDVGCGVGTWLRAAADLGVARIKGLDGPWVTEAQLRIPEPAFERIDFEAANWPVAQSFDLALSLEVAEHLSPEAGRRLVRYLTQSAPVILFSAAIPLQGGEGHINERWQSDWAALFAEFGFRPSLALRNRVWTDPSVEFWYQQNLVLYFAERVSDKFAGIDAPGPLDVVHPRLYDLRVGKPARRRARWRRLLPPPAR